MSDQQLKNLKIKTSVVKRLAKEKVSYEKESEQIKAKIQKMKDDKADEYDIKKQGEVLQESLMMIPDCQRRLTAAWEELNQILTTEKELFPTEEYEASKQVLDDSKVTMHN